MKTVLVVDDEGCIRDLVRVILESGECRVLDAPDGSAGLELAAREHPDVILLDCRMRGLSGEDVLKRLRADGRTASIPIIMMSGLGREHIANYSHLLHADGYLVKPFRPVELLQEIEQVFKAPSCHAVEPRTAA